MRPLRFVLILALLGLFMAVFQAPGQTPAGDRKKLEELLKQNGLSPTPQELAQLEAMMKQRGMTLAQLEQFIKQGSSPDKGGFGGRFGKGGFGGRFGKGGFGGQGGFGGRLGGSQPSPADALNAPLVDAETLAKLKLTLQQRQAYDKLAKEFDAKNKELTSKIPAAPPGSDLRARFEAQIRERFGKGGGGGSAPANPEFQKALDLRKDYEQKFEALLTDAQKKVLEEVRVKQAESLLLGGSK